jgi:hypothetical protein
MSTLTKKTVTTSLSPEELVALDGVRKRDNLHRYFREPGECCIKDNQQKSKWRIPAS